MVSSFPVVLKNNWGRVLLPGRLVALVICNPFPGSLVVVALRALLVLLVRRVLIIGLLLLDPFRGLLEGFLVLREGESAASS